jgi:outer membrane cobalamin receptor
MTIRLSIKACLLCILVNQVATAQYTIFGFVSDVATKERLIGATINILGTKRGAITNAYGFFSLPAISKNDTALIVTYVGYERRIIPIVSNRQNETALDIQLCLSPIESDAVLIEADQDRTNTISTDMGIMSMQINQIECLPSLGGEVDILKAMQLHSGVSSVQELSNGICVRGGSSDQNLVLLDGIPLYNPNHLFGYFSVFNTDAIKNVELIKGGIPAAYGGRLSSVMTFAMNDGNLEETVIKGGVSLIASRISVEGPFSDEKKGSYLVSARRSYFDQIVFAVDPPKDKSASFYIFDLTGKVNYSLTDADRVYGSAYFGNDNFTNSGGSGSDPFDMNLVWGNQAYSIRWNHIWDPKLFSNTSVIYSYYLSNQKSTLYNVNSNKEPSVKDLAINIDGEYAVGANQSISFGTSYIHHRYNLTAGLLENSNEAIKMESQELQFYSSYSTDFSESFRMTSGVRSDYFGSGNFLEVDPRLNIRYLMTEDVSVKMSYTRMHQFVHMLSSSLFTLPGEVYYPATEYLKPETSQQISAGVFSSFMTLGAYSNIDASVEVYYKDLSNLPMFRNRFSSPSEERIREDVILGKGWAYGIDAEISKRSGAWTGWLSYSFLTAWRQYNEKNNGMAFHPRYEHEHQINGYLNYLLTPRWSFGLLFTAASGQPVTVPRQRYYMTQDGTTNNELVDYGEIYSHRLNWYHHLDVSATYAWKGWGIQWELFVNIYNLYNYPLPIVVSYGGNNYFGYDFSQESIGLIPTLGVNFSY